MALLVLVSVPGVNKNQYDTLKKEIHWDTNPPAGLHLHSVGFDNAGLHVADIWENQAAFEAYFGGRIGPGMQKLGVTGQPKVEVYPLHNANAYPGLKQWQAKQTA